MATIKEVSDELTKLEAVYPFRVARSPQQMEQWLLAYFEDLREFPIHAIARACGYWRRSEAKKFPLIGELLPIVINMAKPRSVEVCKPWRAASREEYQTMTIREKIREQKLLAIEAHNKAGPMWRGGRPLLLEEMSADWHRWVEVSKTHDREAKRLRDQLKQYDEAA